MSKLEKPEEFHVQEYIAFRLSKQDFCLNITTVREIRGWSETTPIPRTPDFISGLINLRGAVIPIIDLSLRFGFDATETTQRHVIIVVHISDQSVGLLVDGVSDILTVNSDQLQATPDIGSELAQSFVKHVIANDGGRMIRVIDLDQIIPRDYGKIA